MIKKSFGRDKEKGIFGGIININFSTASVTLTDDDGANHEVPFANLEEFKHITDVDGYSVFERDVFKADDGTIYEVGLTVDGRLGFYKLDEDGNKDSTPTITKHPAELEDVIDALELLGNYYEIDFSKEPTVDFNITIVRERKEDGDVQYYYACNNKEEQSVDLISVVFVGHKLLEKDYFRITLPYEGYLDSVARELFKEVSPNELHNYVTGVTYQSPSVPRDVEDEDAYEDDDYCEDCGADWDECTCVEEDSSPYDTPEVVEYESGCVCNEDESCDVCDPEW